MDVKEQDVGYIIFLVDDLYYVSLYNAYHFILTVDV